MTSFDTTALDLYLVGVLTLAAVALLLSLVTVTTVLVRCGRRHARVAVGRAASPSPAVCP
jgi:hypothetical protein